MEHVHCAKRHLFGSEAAERDDSVQMGIEMSTEHYAVLKQVNGGTMPVQEGAV